ncbi:MAG: phage major capsid protein [Anaerolineaceae bacterium]|nr:phage major capsid protein [Anaerolineaceae bacterium]MDE0327553.1 phage major capsid protein [Anaerolineaceae bacterium]
MQTTLKALDAGGRIGGYLVVWGSPEERDLQGEYFTAETELGLGWYPQRPLLYQHGLDGALKAAVIGAIDTLAPDETGVWAEAQLDLRRRWARAVQRLIEKGALGWSSGSLEHLVEVADDGKIRRWPIVEGSLTPTPAQPRRSDVRTLKSAWEALGMDASLLTEPVTRETQGENMTEKSTTTAARKRLPLASPDEALKLTSVSSPYDSLGAMDMLHGYMLLSATKQFRGVSERFGNALAHKLRREGLSAVKADELSHSTQAGFGDEWVPDLWSGQIWQQARLENAILPLFQSIEMPSNPFELPIEGADPSVYFVPETSDEAHLNLGSGNPIPDSRIGSGKVQLNAKKLALRVGFSAELVEDSIVPVLAVYREQAMRAIIDSIDHVLLNGDTTGNGNVNSNGKTPDSNSRFRAFNGLRKLALVSHSDGRVDANGAPTLALLRSARFRLAARHAARPADLAWIVDSGTYAKLLGLEEFLTMDKAGAQATARSGQIGFMDGAPVIVSAEMPLSEGAAGKVNGKTAGNNTKGTALCVARQGWFVGYRRRIAVSLDYLPYYDSYQLTATVRLAFVSRDNQVASALTNITV